MASPNTKDLLNLFSLFHALDALDLEGLSRVKLIRAFGLMIQNATGIDSIAFAITDDPDESNEHGDSKTVTVVELPSGEARIADRDDSWWKGQLVRHKPGEIVRGVPGPNFGERISLIVPLRFTSCFGAVLIVASKAILNDSDLWATAIFALTEALSTRRQIAKRSERQEFYRDLVETGSRDPKGAVDEICGLWKKLSRADWVWLWLRNEYTGHFELAAFRGDPPPIGFEPGDESASAYAVDNERVCIINGDLANWRREQNGKVYKLQLKHHKGDLEKFNAMVCVPIILKHRSTGLFGDNSRDVHGAVCLHYTDPFATPQQPKDSLVLMGRQCAQMIGNAFLEDQRRILVSLTQMAQRHLTRVTRRPVQVRAEYLQELIQLIQRSLGFKTVSIFYKRPFDEAVECLATTGLATRAPGAEERVKVLHDRLFQIVYASGVGRTGECFRSGNVIIFNPKLNDEAHEPKTFDIDPESGEWVRGVVFQPIARKDTAAQSAKVIGVIRCGGYQNGNGVDRMSLRVTFHPVQIETLGFIAQQVGPLLQIFENNIRRERTISTVKHDLFTNNNMIRDASERIARDRELGRPIREYDIKNVAVSHLMGTNLIAQLDAEPGFKETFNAVSTKLVGDILARVVNLLRHYAFTYRGMKIEYDVGIIDVIPQLKVDRTLIERVIHNLIVNAVKYGTPGSTIRIEAHSSFDGGLGRVNAKPAPTDGYYLEIANEGIGIDEKDADLVGQPNFRAENATQYSVGLGLGLYIARIAMEKHGGSLTLINGRNPTVFSMFFPRRLAA